MGKKLQHATRANKKMCFDDSFCFLISIKCKQRKGCKIFAGYSRTINHRNITHFPSILYPEYLEINYKLSNIKFRKKYEDISSRQLTCNDIYIFGIL